MKEFVSRGPESAEEQVTTPLGEATAVARTA